jgi:AraC-like DNA-binding protein
VGESRVSNSSARTQILAQSGSGDMVVTAFMELVWRYSFECGLEQAVWRGNASASLSPHFHAESQITIVYSGKRRFASQFGLIEASAGQTVILPAGMPHKALGLEANGGVSVNLYVPKGRALDLTRGAAVVVSTPPSVHRRAERPDVFIDNLCELASGNVAKRAGMISYDLELTAAVLSTTAEISVVARAFSMSREGFTRWFARATGMTPHAYRLVARLNDARRLLGIGLSPAAAAADAGFADQSHLGRRFRAAFGTTTAGYRKAMQI